MLEQLKAWDREFLLFINQFHSTTMDPVMFWVTKTEFWIPLYIVLLYLIFRVYRRETGFVLAGVVISLVLSDQITSGLMKPFFERLRPSQEPSLEGLVYIVNGYRGGLYGFASSHAANTLGVAFFVFLLLKKDYRFMWLIFLWAALMSYSRIYLGVHYPGDILVGALVGLFSGYAGFRFYQWFKSAAKKTGQKKSDVNP